MLVGTNLLGIMMRSLQSIFKKNSEATSASLVNISSTNSITMIILLSLISVAYFYALYHFLNIGIMTAGLLLMFTRLPDLLFEIKTGKKINSTNMPKKPIYVICSILAWLALPLIWYSLYYSK
jgi:hypothetical protein